MRVPSLAAPVQALDDFKERIRKYEEVYETITDRNLHYIKLIDMCVFYSLSASNDPSDRPCAGMLFKCCSTGCSRGVSALVCSPTDSKRTTHGFGAVADVRLGPQELSSCGALKP